MVIIEVGAGKGRNTEFIAKKVGVGGQIHVFEPDLLLFNQLQLSPYILNFDNIFLNRKAILHKSCKCTLDTERSRFSNNLISYIIHYFIIASNIFLKLVRYDPSRLFFRINTAQNKPIHFSDNPIISDKVLHIYYDCTTIDDYSASFSRLDLIIVEVSGYSVQALLGAFRTIRKFRPEILINFNEKDLLDKGYCSHFLLQWLKALGYMPFYKSSPVSYDILESKAEIDPNWCFTILFKPEKNLLVRKNEGSKIVIKEESGPPDFIDMKSLRFFYAFPAMNSEIKNLTEQRIERMRYRGYNIKSFCLPLSAPGPLLIWSELDSLWKSKDRTLLNKYELLLREIEGADILINYGGANLHPEFIKTLPTFNVFTCHDDPEASEHLSHYVAPAYDYCFVGNSGCIDMYTGWGIDHVSYLPLGVYDSDRDLTITEEKILNGERDIPIVFLGSKDKHRDYILNKLLIYYPDTLVYGYGWPNKYLPLNEQIKLYGQTKLGWNLDQSVGPATSRTFKLPANGVMLIGNNSSHLGMLYKLGVEAVGFDTIKECVDYTSYYLHNEDERRRIACEGWRRTINCYTEDKIWDEMLEKIKPFIKKVR